MLLSDGTVKWIDFERAEFEEETGSKWFAFELSLVEDVLGCMLQRRYCSVLFFVGAKLKTLLVLSHLRIPTPTEPHCNCPPRVCIVVATI